MGEEMHIPGYLQFGADFNRTRHHICAHIRMMAVGLIAVLSPTFAFGQQTETRTAENVSQSVKAAALLPETTAIFVQIPDPDGLLQTYMNHPIHERLKADSKTAKIYTSPQLMQAKAGIALAELMIGMSYYDMVRSLGGDGITLAVDAENGGVAALFKSPDPKQQKKTLQIIIGAIKKQRRNGNQSEIKTTDYKGIKVYGLDKVKVGVLDEWILLTNNNDLGKTILEASLDQPEDNLATQDWFKQSIKSVGEQAVAKAAIHLARIRDEGGMQKMLEGTKGNPVAELLVGGVFENLKHSDFATGQLKMDDDSLNLTFKTPHDQNWIPEEREFFFGPNGSGVAKAAMKADKTVFNISFYRDIAKMWLHGGDLFNQRVNDGMAEAESNLSTLFAGKDFVEEILGLIKPEAQLVVSRQSFEGRLPIPAMKLPSFALVGELKDPETMQAELRRTFQSAIGFFNVIGAMEGNPQMDQDIVMVGDAKVLTASFVPTPEDKESKSATMHYNFSPSLALAGDHFVLSSSLPLAKELAAKVKDGNANHPDAANLHLKLVADALQSALAENKEFLISNNMLEEGNTRKEAEQDIELLLTIVGLFDGFKAKLVPTKSELKLDLNLQLAN